MAEASDPQGRPDDEPDRTDDGSDGSDGGGSGHGGGDPFGRFRAGMLSPVRDGWADGDRQLTCGLIASAGLTEADADAAPNRLVSFTGQVSGADQSLVWPTGTCVEFVGEESRAADCAAPHHALVTGVATMPDTSNGQPPSDVAYRELAVPLC
nr:septum formation family protein [Micromonospora sp. DSM 115978]